MKDILKRLLTVLMLLLCFADTSFAETNASFAVSFTIPVMPGINAPLLDQDKSPQTQAPLNTQQNVETKKETESQAPTLLENEKQEESKEPGQTSQILVKTLYPR